MAITGVPGSKNNAQNAQYIKSANLQDLSYLWRSAQVAREQLGNIDLVNDTEIRDFNYLHRAQKQAINKLKTEASQAIKNELLQTAKTTLKQTRFKEFSDMLEDEAFLNEMGQVVEGAQRSGKSRTVALAQAIATFSISMVSRKLWTTWQWSSIPTIISGIGIINFMLATLASFVALLRTAIGGVLKRMLGRYAFAALPPAFSFLPGISRSDGKISIGIGAGMSEFAFFMTALAIWLVIGILISAIIAVIAIPIIDPSFALELLYEFGF